MRIAQVLRATVNGPIYLVSTAAQHMHDAGTATLSSLQAGGAAVHAAGKGVAAAARLAAPAAQAGTGQLGQQVQQRLRQASLQMTKDCL